MKHLLLLFSVMLCLVSSADATTYYVDDDTGNNADDGLTAGNAWQTLEYAWNTSALACGDTLRVLAGNYYQQNLRKGTRVCTALSPIVVMADNPADRPKIYGSKIIPGASWTNIAATNIWYYTLTNATERLPWELYQEKAGVRKRYKHASYPTVSDADDPYKKSDLLVVTTAAPDPNTQVVFPADLDALDQDGLGFAALGAVSDYVIYFGVAENATYECPVSAWDATNDRVTLPFNTANCTPSKSRITGDQVGYRSCRFLSAAGQFCIETVGTVHTVYVRPYDDDTPNTAGLELHLPQEQWFWVGDGTASNYTTFNGFNFYFFEKWKSDTVPVSETCSGCSSLFFGADNDGFHLKNFIHSYSRGGSLFKAGISTTGGLLGSPSVEDFECSYNIGTGCGRIVYSHPDSVFTYKNGQINNVTGDVMFIGTGGPEYWPWGTPFSVGGEIVLDNVDMDGCTYDGPVHEDCIHIHTLNKLTIINGSEILHEPTLQPDTSVSQGGFMWSNTCLGKFTLRNSTVADGKITFNATASYEIVNSTLHGISFHGGPNTATSAECQHTGWIFTGNNWDSYSEWGYGSCDQAATGTNCDPARDLFNVLTNQPVNMDVGCNGFAGALFPASGSSAHEVHHQVESFWEGAGASLPDNQKYEYTWLKTVGWPNLAYGLKTTLPAAAVAQVDTDADTIWSCFDNCLASANTTQLDSDGDGYGNPCDADFNNDGVVGGPDFFKLKQCFGSTIPATDPSCDQTDINGDGVVGGPDFFAQRAVFGGAPGPSCCGTFGGASAMSSEGSAPQSNNQTVTVP